MDGEVARGATTRAAACYTGTPVRPLGRFRVTALLPNSQSSSQSHVTGTARFYSFSGPVFGVPACPLLSVVDTTQLHGGVKHSNIL